MLLAMLRSGLISSATACSTEAAGACSRTKPKSCTASSRCTAGQRFLPFCGSKDLQDRLGQKVAAAPDLLGPMDAMTSALEPTEIFVPERWVLDRRRSVRLQVALSSSARGAENRDGSLPTVFLNVGSSCSQRALSKRLMAQR